MSNLLYLVLAIVISLVGSLILWMRTRQPKSMDSGIEQFSRELKALAPDTELPDSRGRRSTTTRDRGQGERRSG